MQKLFNGSAVQPLILFINPVWGLPQQPSHSVSLGTCVQASGLEASIPAWLSVGMSVSRASRPTLNMADPAVWRDD